MASWNYVGLCGLKYVGVCGPKSVGVCGPDKQLSWSGLSMALLSTTGSQRPDEKAFSAPPPKHPKNFTLHSQELVNWESLQKWRFVFDIFDWASKLLLQVVHTLILYLHFIVTAVENYVKNFFCRWLCICTSMPCILYLVFLLLILYVCIYVFLLKTVL